MTVNFAAMHYTKYFSTLVREQGVPHLNTDQFRRMMNIVYVEGLIEGMQKIKSREKSQLFKYDMLIFKQNQALTKLTGNLQPNQLMREMYHMSNA